MTRVLVVDDSAIDRHLAGRLLEKLGDVEVFYAEDGVRGLEQVEAHVPDLVLTDMQMPELDGFGLVEAMRKQFPLIPVVLMTAAGSEEIAVRALQSGGIQLRPEKMLGGRLGRGRPSCADHLADAAKAGTHSESHQTFGHRIRDRE